MEIRNRRIRFATVQIPVLVLAAVLSADLAARAQQPAGFGVVKTINVDINPFGDTLSPDGKTVWVTNSGTVYNNSDKVTLIDVASLTEEPNKISVGEFPEAIAFGRLGKRAFITNSTSATVSVVNVGTKQVTQTVDLSQVPDNFPYGVAVGLGNRQIFVTTQGSYNLLPVLANNAAVTVKTSIPVTGYSALPAVVPINIVAPALSGKLLVPITPSSGSPELDIVDPATDEVINYVVVPAAYATASPNAVAASPDGHYAYVTLANFSGGPGGLWVIDLTDLSTVTVVNTGDPAAYGVSVTPNGRYALVTNFLVDTAALVSTVTDQVVGTVAVGINPNQSAITVDSNEAFVTNQGSTTVTVLSLPH